MDKTKLIVECCHCGESIIKEIDNTGIVDLSEFEEREWACFKCDSVTSVNTNLCGYTAKFLSKIGSDLEIVIN